MPPILGALGAASAGSFGFLKLKASGPTINIQYLIVGGGSCGGVSGGSHVAGGGGAGGANRGFFRFLIGAPITVSIGGGAAAPISTTSPDWQVANGGDSYIQGGGSARITGYGGGYGGGYTGGPTSGNSGGSGGGGGPQDSGSPSLYPTQGNAGGAGQNPGSAIQGLGGGGGGAGAAGGQGPGGNGFTWIDGVVYAGGGGGGAGSTRTIQPGGTGGGGNGAIYPGTGTGAVGAPGGANLGGGGGGASTQPGGGLTGGGAGGSGVVVLAQFLSPPDGSPNAPATTTGSPTITTDATYRYYKFTGAGTITFV
jgi:hypothetical protein